MVDVELTELQTKLYDVLKDGDPSSKNSKKALATKLGTQVRSISSPLKSMVDSGVLVTDEYGDFSIGAGVREETDDGCLSVPSITNTTPFDEETPALEVDEEDDDLFSEYWQRHPEELVTFYQEEGLDALKRSALTSALENTPGVGAKALNAAIHWFDIDEDVRRDPTTLMRALEDAGVKHTIVGRVARETFLPEKQYGSYVKAETDIIIDRRRQPARQRTRVESSRRRDRDPDEFYEERYPEPNRRNQAPRNDEEPPWWYNNLMSKLDMNTPEQNETPWQGSLQPQVQGSPQPQVVVEPALDREGNPVPDPDNPGHYLERKLVYDPPAQHTPQQDPYDSDRLDQVMQTVELQRAELSKLRDVLADHETERKINSAIDPLLSKIAGLEKTEPIRKAGLSDEQYKLQTEKEIVQDMTGSIEHTVSTIITPVLEGLSEMQRATAMRDIIQLEKEDKVEHGTYLKYMIPGARAEEPISPERISGTISNIRNLTRGAK